MTSQPIPWIDLDAYRLRLTAVQLPSGQRILTATGDIEPHQGALIALGFQRTARGHIVYPASRLSFRLVSAQFPQARMREMPVSDVVRISPPPGAGDPSLPGREESTARAPDTFAGVREAEFLGINRRLQGVFRDTMGERFLQGEPAFDFGPLDPTDYLRSRSPEDLPAVVRGLVYRAARQVRLHSEHLARFAEHIESDWLPHGGPHEQARRHHIVQETLEATAVQVAAERLRGFQAAGGFHKALFDEAVVLSEHLPPHRFRSGFTIAMAQYSTPLPIALAAQVALGPISAGRTVLDPTAGHGMLLTGMPRAVRIRAVEWDAERAARLQANFPQAVVEVGDILKILRDDEAAVDYIIANPPYGALKDYSGQSRAMVRVPGTPGFATQRLDHYILLHTLKQRHPEGRAVFLIGADHPRNHQLEKPAGGSRYLLNFLADHYHVEAVLGIHGDLYRSMGSHYPVRLVVIGEQGSGFDPVPETTPVVTSWDELYQATCELSRIGPSGLERRLPEQLGDAVGEALIPAAAPDVPAPAERPLKPDADELLEPAVDAQPVVYQERYQARSRAGEPITMVPANMALATRKALDRVETEQDCDVDPFVARELRRPAATLGEVFSPEQIDALALAIHALKRGRGFIESDETGIGKGRVLAGLTEWAWHQRRPVIFLTEKPNLFSDFYRDLRHVGLRDRTRLLVVNADTPIKDTERGDTLIAGTPGASLRPWIDKEGLPPGTNLVMTTYSQINRGLASPHGHKARWLESIARQTGAMVILDESHNAAGDSNTHANVCALLNAGHYRVYSSATYAKRPDNMALYASALPERYKNDDIGLLLAAGGPPLQEVFSQMLAEDGVLIRREHDLSNLTFRAMPDHEHRERNHRLADGLAGILEKMAYLGGDIAAWVSEQNKILLERLEASGEQDQRKGNRAGLQSMNFGSRLYQLNRLFLMALKVDLASAFAVDEIKAGRKPVIVVENTMETLLRAVIDNAFEEGDKEASRTLTDSYPMLSFRDALQRVADRMMTVTERNGYGEITRRPITEEALLELHAVLSREIAAYPDLDLSPLDTIAAAINRAGYSCGELSGRTFRVAIVEPPDGDTSVAERRMVVQARAPENRSDLIYAFNTGEYDALIMTRSGATGLSLHARDDIPGWSPAPRALFELQIPQNVAERIQFWGRVNRRGQCCPPTIVTPSSELPGEVRLISMQNAKLRALSANTTSNQDSAALTRTIPDLLNHIGNQVAREWVQQNPIDAGILEASIGEAHDAVPQWYVNRVMSRIMLFSVDQQEQILEQLAENYQVLIAQYRSQGRDPFRTFEADWRARVVNRVSYEGAPVAEAGSVFDAPVDFTTLEYRLAVQPICADQVERWIALGHADYDRDATWKTLLKHRASRLHLATLPYGQFAGVESVEAGLQVEGTNPVKRTHHSLAQIGDFLEQVEIGAVIAWDELRGEDEPPDRLIGRVVAIHPPPEKAIYLPGQYRVRIAVPGHERLAAKSIYALNKAGYTVLDDDPEPLMRAFDEAEGGMQKRRAHLLTGNLYSALLIATRRSLGSPIIYTNADGARERGVLLRPGVGLEEMRAQPLVLRGPAPLLRFLADHANDKTLLVAANGSGMGQKLDYRRDFVLEINRGALTLSVPGAKSLNGQLLLDPAWQALELQESLAGNRTALQCEIQTQDRAEVAAVLGDRFSWIAQPHYRDWYNHYQESLAAGVEEVVPTSNRKAAAWRA